MKKITISFVSILCVIGAVIAQDKLFIHKTDKSVLEYLVAAIDNVYFGNSNTELNIKKTDGSIVTYQVSGIDSINFGTGTDTVTVVYSGTTATITNPLKGHGVEITQSGADVVVKSTLDQNEVTYILSGTTTEGSFKVYSNYRLTLNLNGVNITNSDGPAINVQSSKKISVVIPTGTTNTLTDGTTYATSTEDQKGAFFSEGQLQFSGTGTLNVKSLSRHAICSDDYVQIDGGTIVVTAAAKDGIHSKDYFRMNAGTLNLTTTGDGVECETGHVIVNGGTITASESASDAKGLTADSTLVVNGGTINLTVAGAQGKGLKSKKAMTLAGGTINITSTGAAVLTALNLGYDVSYCTGIKSAGILTLSGSKITISATGAGSKGISSDSIINMTAGTVYINNSGAGAKYTNSAGGVDAYSSACMDADRNINLLGGTFTGIASGTAAKGISTDGNLTIGSAATTPVVYVKNTGTKLLVSGTANYTTAVYSEPKNLKSDGILTIAGGTVKLNATQQGANTIDSDSLLYVTGGTITDTISGGQAKGFKATRDMTFSGGTITIVASGGVILENLTASTYDPSYCAGIKGDAAVNLSGSSITMTGSGAAFKGISSTGNITMTSGTVQITNSGTGTTFTGATATDSYSAACVTSDANISIIGGTLTCSATGAGGKGISADGAVSIGSASTSPTVNLTTSGARFLVSGTDYCHAKTLVATGAVTITSGTNTLTSTDDGIHSETSLTISGGTNTITASSTTSGVGEGLESKYIYITGGTNTITASNDGINATFGTVSGGTESKDGSLLSVSGGTTYVTGADAIDSNGAFTMTGGVLFSNGPASGAEEFCDTNGSSNINGGVFVGCGSSQMQKSSIFTSSTQSNLYITTTLSTSTMYTVAIAGVGVVSFKPAKGGGVCFVSAPQMVKGASYVVYTGGTYTGATTANNLYYGGTFSSTGATSKKTGTLSTSSTLNTISF